MRNVTAEIFSDAIGMPGLVVRKGEVGKMSATQGTERLRRHSIFASAVLSWLMLRREAGSPWCCQCLLSLESLRSVCLLVLDVERDNATRI